MRVLDSSPPNNLVCRELIDLKSVLANGREQIDFDLSRRVADGDELALAEVYRLYSRPVFGLLLRLLPERTSAEDVQQQVFTEVWQKAKSFDPARGSMLGWIMAIARSRAIDHLRKRIPEPQDPEKAAEVVDQTRSSGEIDHLIDSFQFAQLLDRLPEDEAVLIRYRFQNELSQSEISERTGIPLGTVKSRMVSALGRLRVQMEAEG